MAHDQEASSSSGVQAPESEVMFKERLEDESNRLQLKYGRDAKFTALVPQILLSVFDGNLEELKSLMKDVESVNVALRQELDSTTPLHVAAQFGHVEIVKWIRESRSERNMNALDANGFTALSLACRSRLGSEAVDDVMAELFLAEDLDANIGNNYSPLEVALATGKDWCVIHKLLEWNPGTFPRLDIHYKDNVGGTALHAAAFGGNVGVIDKLLKSYPTLKVGTLDYFNRLPLHHAASDGKFEAIQKLLGDELGLVNTPENDWRLTPLHYAVLSNSPETVEAILKVGGKDLKVDQPDWEGSTPLDYARSWYVDRKMVYRGSLSAQYVSMTKDNARKIVKMLEGFDISGLRTERQVYVDCANAILVGAAVIASVTFSSWLQPPLGLTPYYESQFLLSSPAAPPDTYESFVGIKDHWTIEMFWIFNTLSFFFAVATIIGGADAALPKRGMLLKDAVRQARHAVLRACSLLIVSMVCVIGAFASAGFTVLPPIFKYQRNMIGSVCIGGAVCLFVLWKVIVKIFSWTSLEEIREYFTSLSFI